MYKKWFTLIELLIAVSISALVMTSIMIFTWDMIRNSIKGQKTLITQNNNFQFENKIQDSLENITWTGIFYSWSIIWNYWTWLILKSSGNNSSLIYIWLKTFTWYCDFAWAQASATWTVNKLIIKELVAKNSHTTSANYYIDISKNSIYTSGWILAVWTLIKGSEYWDTWILTELSNPVAISEWNGYLYIADNGNNRILSYNMTSKQIEIIATNLDWINNPTDILYSAWELYITNVWGNNILKIKDGYWDWNSLNIDNLKVWMPLVFDKLEFKFDWISSILSPNSNSQFTFNWWISKTINDTVSTWASLIYLFSWTTNTLNINTPYQININDINPVPSIIWSYWVKINFYLAGILTKSLNQLYYIKWDSTIWTKEWNIITIFTWWITYPNNITSSSNRDSNIVSWSWLLNNTWSSEYISEFPVKDLTYWLVNKLLNIKYNYYKTYDCINEKHIIKERKYLKYLN